MTRASFSILEVKRHKGFQLSLSHERRNILLSVKEMKRKELSAVFLKWQSRERERP